MIPWKKEWQPTPAFLPGECHGQRSLVGYSPWGRIESDMTEWLTLSLSNLFWHQGLVSWKTIFSQIGGGWFQDDSSILRLLCALFILLSHQLHLRSSGIRSWKLGTPVLWHLQFLKNPEYHLPTPVMVSIYLFIPGTSHLPWPEPSPSTHASPYWLWGKREQTRASCQHCGGFSVWPGQPQRPIPWQTRAEAQAMRWGLLNLSLRSASPEHSPWSYCWCSLLAAFWWCRHGAWAPYEEGLQGCEVGHGQRRAERCEVRRVLAKAQFQKGGKSPDLQGPCLTCWPPPHSPGAFSSASMKVSSSWQMLQ